MDTAQTTNTLTINASGVQQWRKKERQEKRIKSVVIESCNCYWMKQEECVPSWRTIKTFHYSLLLLDDFAA